MLIIRDDDTSYWTSPDELDAVYGKYLKEGVKVSLAVVPNAFNLYHKGDRTQLYLSEERRVISDNRALVDYLLPFVRSGQIEIMQHGFDHSYAIRNGADTELLSKVVRENVGMTSNLQFVPECIYKTDALIKKEFSEGKEILEDTFGVRVSTFVPPSNALRPAAVNVVEQLGMNISGTMTNKFNRDRDIYGILNYVKKGIWHLAQKNITCPYVLRYRGHRELTGYAFTPITDYQGFEYKYRFLLNKGFDFTVSTHYWEILNNRSLHESFDGFMSKYATKESTICLREAFRR